MSNIEVTAIDLDKLTPYRRGNVVALTTVNTYVELLRGMIESNAAAARAADQLHDAEFMPTKVVKQLLTEISGRIAYDVHDAAGLPIPEPLACFAPKK